MDFSFHALVINILLFISLYFEIFLLLTFLESTTKNKGIEFTPTYYPSATIMVPVWNEEETVSKTVNSLLNLNYPKDKFKVVVIDDGSTDDTAKVLEAFANHPQVTILHKENGGKYTALNFGLKHIDTELIGCLDADSFVDSQALIHIVEQFENKSIMAVTPSIKVFEAKSVVQFIQKAEYHLSAFIRYVLSMLNSQYITPGPFSIFRREVFEKLGHYKHAHNTEDMEIALRMQANHMKIANAPNAYVYTITPETVYKLYKQRLRWIHGGMENLIDYRFMLFNRNYGNLSVFILPVVLVSIGSAIYFILLMILKLIFGAVNLILNISAIGLGNFRPNFSSDFLMPSFDYFSILGSLFATAIVVTILLGKYIGKDQVRLSLDVFLYMLLYGFIAPFWFFKAVYNTILSRKTTWR